jgi:hypothetical protein
MKIKAASLPKPEIQRPTVYDPAIADRICERLAGGENLRRFCIWPDWPTKRTVQQWAKEQPEFGVKMRRILRTRQTVIANSGGSAGHFAPSRTNTRDHAHARGQ